MRKYNMLVTAAILVAFVVLIVLMISEMVPTASTETWEEVVETVKDVPSETVFEPIENDTETEEITTDTSENAPKMDGNEAEVAPSCENLAYTDEDLLYLAKVVQNEAGSDYCTDEHQQYVASVVLNRVNSPRFPGESILEVALCGYGDGYPVQYDYSLFGGGVEGFNSIDPTERAIQNARFVLENGVLDDTVVWQANFVQGKVVKKFTYDFAIPPTTYICR